MIVHELLGTTRVDSSYADVVAMGALGAFPLGMALQNDSYLYGAHYYGPSNSAPGHIWDLDEDEVYEGLTFRRWYRTPWGTITAWDYDNGEDPRLMVITRRMSYVIHLREGLFLRLD